MGSTATTNFSTHCLKMANCLKDNEEEFHHMEEEEEVDEQNWEDWTADGEEEIGDRELLLCLFCDSKYNSSDSLFEHCRSSHHFDFRSIRTTYSLDFYGCFKLINYVRSQVAQKRCWSCESSFQSMQELQDHLHETFVFKGATLPWDNDIYLKPNVEEDPLLYSFGEDEDDWMTTADEGLLRNVESVEGLCIDDGHELETSASNFRLGTCTGSGVSEIVSTSKTSGASPLEGAEVYANNAKENGSYDRMPDDRNSNSSVNIDGSEVMIVNKSYFGSYGSFGIHREMLSDKVRTDAYRQAIIDNPSLLKGAAVLDVGCGTGILSLFAAQAGASIVNAVEASDKMASVAFQIVLDNGLLWNGVSNESNNRSGVIRIINGMVEDLIGSGPIKPHSIDVLLSEWMGYCLLYESMLSSVLVARDQWLKPGGAILPDTATMFVAGFGKGATSIPFWENVYGFNMSCIGKELVEDAARIPIVDVVNGTDLVTNAAVLQEFDLVTMKPEEVDFTATVQLEQKLDRLPDSTDRGPKITKCYGVVLWFETCFSSRFCKDKPICLSTSPYALPTHWSQTILTFREPIAIASKMLLNKNSSTVGTDASPAVKMSSRISIARGVQHRSIDISLEVTAIGFDGRKHKWPVQMFNLR